MKKIFPTLICVMLILSLSACGGAAEKTGDNMSLEEVFESIQADVPNLPEVAFTELNKDNYHYYLFVEPVKGAEALACDAIINAVPHSAVLLRIAEGGDAEAIAAEIRANADTGKWICVNAEAMDVAVHNRTVLLVMSNRETVDAMVDNFDRLWA
ncbi:MAG: hypothetical protein GXY26_01260 [Clostridiales bacterium]|nr:hypothetical protein [Clostridiales bacterium]